MEDVGDNSDCGSEEREREIAVMDEDAIRREREEMAGSAIFRQLEAEEEEEEEANSFESIYDPATVEEENISTFEQVERIRLETERLSLEEEERNREAREVINLMIQQQSLAKSLRESEELRVKEEMRKKKMVEARRRLEVLQKEGGIMISGWITAQKEGSLVWRRRWFELTANTFVLHKNEKVGIVSLWHMFID